MTNTIPKVQHQPSPMINGVPPYAVALAERANARGRVAIYAGAGISLAQPTGLPTGAALAQTIYARLQTAFPALNDVDSSDLTAVADAVAALSNGEEATKLWAIPSATQTQGSHCAPTRT